MSYIELACFIVGLFAVVVGYRRNRRGLLLAGAIAWLIAGGLGDFARGFQQGLSATTSVSSK